MIAAGGGKLVGALEFLTFKGGKPGSIAGPLEGGWAECFSTDPSGKTGPTPGTPGGGIPPAGFWIEKQWDCGGFRVERKARGAGGKCCMVSVGFGIMC